MSITDSGIWYPGVVVSECFSVGGARSGLSVNWKMSLQLRRKISLHIRPHSPPPLCVNKAILSRFLQLFDPQLLVGFISYITGKTPVARLWHARQSNIREALLCDWKRRLIRSNRLWKWIQRKTHWQWLCLKINTSFGSATVLLIYLPTLPKHQKRVHHVLSTPGHPEAALAARSGPTPFYHAECWFFLKFVIHNMLIICKFTHFTLTVNNILCWQCTWVDCGVPAAKVILSLLPPTVFMITVAFGDAEYRRKT